LTSTDKIAIDFVGWYSRYRDLVDERLRELFARHAGGVYNLGRYHMGWTDAQGRAVEAESGKRLRPALCLAACNGYAEPERAVGVAAALELLHAFSLAHDDIEDMDRERRHRPTLWDVFGVPMALNAGDALFAQAFEAIHEGLAALPPERITLALCRFVNTCLRLVEGQHLDMEFERQPSVSVEAYVRMARGKTGALIGAALALGATCGGASEEDVERLDQAGLELGLAFQAADDLLAFWGDPAETGKAVGNDLERGKKSLPVAFAAERGLTCERLRGLPLQAVLAELERVESRDRCEAFARERADLARRLIGETAISRTGAAQLGELIDFSVTRVH
jgi:geranylgeranyl diphosphate synthase type I